LPNQWRNPLRTAATTSQRESCRRECDAKPRKSRTEQLEQCFM
jgi:hypothetical protein